MSLEVGKSGVPVPEGVVELWKGGVGSREPTETQLGPKPWQKAYYFPISKQKMCHVELQLIGTQQRKS